MPKSGEVLEVLVAYHAIWAYGFFHYVDGSIEIFKVGSGPLDSEGCFDIAVPDFSKSEMPIFVSDASLTVVVRGSRTWNGVKEVVPPVNLRRDHCGMRILSQYPSEVLFSPV
jgi:hypothetical protein